MKDQQTDLPPNVAPIKDFLRVIPPAAGNPTGPTLTRGTQVFCGDKPVGGVIGIKLIAVVDDVWRAEITCHVLPPPVDINYQGAIRLVDATTIESGSWDARRVKQLTLWQRIKAVFVP